jgi:hypothetical protein
MSGIKRLPDIVLYVLANVAVRIYIPVAGFRCTGHGAKLQNAPVHGFELHYRQASFERKLLAWFWL